MQETLSPGAEKAIREGASVAEAYERPGTTSDDIGVPVLSHDRTKLSAEEIEKRVAAELVAREGLPAGEAEPETFMNDQPHFDDEAA